MACYAIRDSHDPVLELKKVVHDSKVGPNGHERAGDYLPLPRANGRRSANLIFSVPGFGLGGATGVTNAPITTVLHGANHIAHVTGLAGNYPPIDVPFHIALATLNAGVTDLEGRPIDMVPMGLPTDVPWPTNHSATRSRHG